MTEGDLGVSVPIIWGRGGFGFCSIPLGFSDCSNELKPLPGLVIDVHCQDNISMFLLEA